MVGPLSKTKIKPKTKGAPDFKEKKYKVGQKQKALNETRTAFKAKRVTLATQSILSNKPSTAESIVTECLTRCRHYSAKKRAEAFQELKRMDSLPESVTFSVLSTTFSALIDEDADVRKLLKPLLVQIITRIPSTSISPFTEMIALHIRSAVSHVDPAVRTDLHDVLRALLPFGVIRRSAAAELLRCFCEQKLKLQSIDIVKGLLSVLLARDGHSDQWRARNIMLSGSLSDLTACAAPGDLFNEPPQISKVKALLIAELERLQVAYAPVDRATTKRGEAAALCLVAECLGNLGVSAQERSKAVDGKMENGKNEGQEKRPVQKAKKGGSFAALMEDGDD